MKQSLDLLIKSTFLAPHRDYQSMINQIHNFIDSAHYPIRIVLFSSKKQDIFNYFDGVNYNTVRISKIHYENNILSGELSRNYGRKEIKILQGKFLIFKHREHDIFIALTYEDRHFFENGLLYYIKNRYPIFSMPFFYSWDMEVMLDNLAKSNPQNIIMLTKFSRRSRIKSINSRKLKESDLTWTDMPYKEIFNHTRQSDAWMEKVCFDFVFKSGNINNKILIGYISREGIFKCDLNFKLFYDNIIERSIDIYHKRKEILLNRARKKENNFKSKPLFIEFDEPIFKNKLNNERLIKSLKRMTHLNYSVLHSNPYLHVTATDCLDNSNYEIWVLSDNKITISPQTVCSMSALNRLCDYLSMDFDEGRVKDFNEVV